MSTDEKNICRIISEAVSNLPSERREYILGYAEGVIAMAAAVRADAQDSAWAERTQDSA